MNQAPRPAAGGGLVRRVAVRSLLGAVVAVSVGAALLSPMPGTAQQAAASVAHTGSGSAAGGGLVLAQTGGFGDVAGDAYYADAVSALAAAGVFAGTECAPGLLCPSEPIDRKTMAVWTVRVLDGRDPPAISRTRFDDVDAAGFYGPFIERMAELGVTRGCGDGSGFCPDTTVTRAQMAVFLSRAYSLPAGPNPGFADVPDDAWYGDEVARLAASGITVGCGAGTNFCPSRATTRAQMATFLWRAEQRSDDTPAVEVSADGTPVTVPRGRSFVAEFDTVTVEGSAGALSGEASVSLSETAVGTADVPSGEELAAAPISLSVTGAEIARPLTFRYEVDTSSLTPTGVVPAWYSDELGSWVPLDAQSVVIGDGEVTFTADLADAEAVSAATVYGPVMFAGSGGPGAALGATDSLLALATVVVVGLVIFLGVGTTTAFLALNSDSVDDVLRLLFSLTADEPDCDQFGLPPWVRSVSDSDAGLSRERARLHTCAESSGDNLLVKVANNRNYGIELDAPIGRHRVSLPGGRNPADSLEIAIKEIAEQAIGDSYLWPRSQSEFVLPPQRRQWSADWRPTGKTLIVDGIRIGLDLLGIVIPAVEQARDAEIIGCLKGLLENYNIIAIDITDHGDWASALETAASCFIATRTEQARVGKEVIDAIAAVKTALSWVSTVNSAAKWGRTAASLLKDVESLNATIDVSVHACPSADAAQLVAYVADDGVWITNPYSHGICRLVPGGSHPAWSPDGTRLAYADDAHRAIRVFDLKTRDVSSIVPYVAASSKPVTAVFDLAWSPEGDEIAYTALSDGGYDIWVAKTDGTGSRRTLNGSDSAGEYQPAWSPDGTQIAYASDRDGDNDIYIVNADGTGTPRNITDGPRTVTTPNWRDLSDGNETYPAWANDGQIAFASDRASTNGNSDIYRIADQNDTTWAAVTADPNQDQTQPTWSPDSNRLAFAYKTPTADTHDIGIAHFSFFAIEFEPIAQDEVQENHPTWAPCETRGRTCNSSSRAQPHGSAQNLVAYDTIDPQGFVIENPDGSGRRFFPYAAVATQRPAMHTGYYSRVTSDPIPWSPDGQYILSREHRSSSGSSDFWVSTLDEQPERWRLLSGVSNRHAHNVSWRWSPDSRNLDYFTISDGICCEWWITDPRGANKHKVADGVRNLWWSPSGKYYIYVLIVDSNNNGIWDPEDILELWIATSDGSSRRQLTDQYDGIGPSWSADGSHFAYVVPLFDDDDDFSDRAEVHIVSVEDGYERTQVFRSGSAVVHFSPDGSMVAYDTLGPLWVENIDGTDQRELDGADPKWSPDSTRLAYVTPTADAFLVTSTGDSEFGDIRISYRHVRRHSVVGDIILWSADNKHVGYDIWLRDDDNPYSPKSSHRIINLDNHHEQVFPRDASPPAWSSDGAHYSFSVWTDKNNDGSTNYYDGEHSLWIVTAGGHNRHKLSDNYVIKTASWSPSSEYIMYQTDDLTWWIASLIDYSQRELPLGRSYPYDPAWFMTG